MKSEYFPLFIVKSWFLTVGGKDGNFRDKFIKLGKDGNFRDKFIKLIALRNSISFIYIQRERESQKKVSTKNKILSTTKLNFYHLRRRVRKKNCLY